MAQTDTRGTPRKVVQMKSPFLRLPAEIRRMIYRYVLISPSGTIYSNALRSPALSLDWDLSMDISLLRTCRQVYKEASAILYGENHVHDFCFESELRGGSERLRFFHFPLNLVQSLEVTFYVSYYAAMSIEGICTFLRKSLIAQQCSLKRMILRYKHISGNERDLLDLRSGRGFKLLELMFAVQVLKVLEVIFECWEPKACLKPKAYLAALWSEPIQRLAVKKSWIATETYETSIPLRDFEDPEVEMRYSIRPETAIIRINHDRLSSKDS